ncbi:NUDIX domain-containing protein [Microvirga pudoricolor]|uniref:NUDIX domain-containing protein n=1 Tax=Microvirga pudoricolor TaxID=2778729 RepID=UPI00194EB06A|nr:NUDIX domain-containing protein [Microvirga pudoricolor]MBM6594699.1 NUDIX domain-containing protein [Microvirga pudoricolor]
MADHEITTTNLVFQGWRKVYDLVVRSPSGATFRREIVDRGSAAAVLPYDARNRTVVLVRQFRAPVMFCGGPEYLVETVAGLLDGDDPETCARRETLEEAGLRIEALEPVGAAWSAPGATTERIHMFLAPYTPESRVAAGGGLAEEHEELEVLEIGFDELDAMLARGEFLDLKTIVLIQALKLKHAGLFANP